MRAQLQGGGVLGAGTTPRGEGHRCGHNSKGGGAGLRCGHNSKGGGVLGAGTTPRGGLRCRSNRSYVRVRQKRDIYRGTYLY